jgi:16S rRNA U1498 N3-methylase RsmE
LGVGEAVVLFDGSGTEYPAEILEVGRQLVRFKVAAGTRIDRTLLFRKSLSSE